jgi:3-oxoacyl-[acyl-carrier-protein] synthase-3
MVSNVGILGIGVYLPAEVRTNAWWPPAVVDGWRERIGATRAVLGNTGAVESPVESLGVRRVLAAIEQASEDIFQGAFERRVMPDGMLGSEMEIAAAREALELSGVPVSDIGLVLAHSHCPDFIGVPDACTVHHALGLPERCITLSADGSFNSFLLQLSIAEAMIASGVVRSALLLQSSASSRLVESRDPSSLFFGDAATAVVVGRVGEGRGILGRAHRTDGSLDRTVVCGIPGRRWYEEGRDILYVDDVQQSRKMILGVADCAEQTVTEALAEARLGPSDVSYYAAHQGTAWLQQVTKEHVGLGHARSVATFRETASVGSCNLPLLLREGARKGLLRDGDVAVLFSGGSGITWSSIALRWGR